MANTVLDSDEDEERLYSINKKRQETFDNCKRKEKSTVYCAECKELCMAHLIK